MNRFKEKEIEEWEQGFSNPPDVMVSKDLFPQKVVRDYIAQNGAMGICHYTNKSDLVVPLKEVVQIIRDTILQYYGDPDNEGAGFDSHFEKEEEDGAMGWHSDNGYILPPSRKIYDADELMYRERFWTWDDSLTQTITDCFQYRRWVYQDPYGLTDNEEMELQWKEYCRETIDEVSQGILFSNVLANNLSTLNDVTQIMVNNTRHLFKTLPIGTHLYRCVKYATQLKSIALADLASPPSKFAAENRMSPKGVSTFYSSFDKATPLAEAQAVIGMQCAYVGEFSLIKDVLVLDLTHLPQAPSIFDKEDYWGIRFLHEFSRAISKYIPSSNPIEYVPTQLMVEFLKQSPAILGKTITGIIYNSSKVQNPNCALFLDYSQCPQYMQLKTYSTHGNDIC